MTKHVLRLLYTAMELRDTCFAGLKASRRRDILVECIRGDGEFDWDSSDIQLKTLLQIENQMSYASAAMRDRDPGTTGVCVRTFISRVPDAWLLREAVSLAPPSRRCVFGVSKSAIIAERRLPDLGILGTDEKRQSESLIRYLMAAEDPFEAISHRFPFGMHRNDFLISAFRNAFLRI